MPKLSPLARILRSVLLLVPAVAAAGTVTRAAVPTSPPTGELRISVLLNAGEQKKPAAGAVVWIPGSVRPRPSEAASKDAPRITSKMKRFEPRIAAVPVGSTVNFPNLDKIFHNVFSLSDKAPFDLGLYKNGASKPVKFEKPGLVRIYCNIHPQMAAYLMVVDGEIFGLTGVDGTVRLAEVPAGRRSVKLWDEKGGESMATVDVLPGRTSSLTVELQGSSWREVPHKNKYGTDYLPPDDDENRY